MILNIFLLHNIENNHDKYFSKGITHIPKHIDLNMHRRNSHDKILFCIYDNHP